MSEVARLLCHAIELRAAAERAGGHRATSSVLECSAEMIEEATPLGQRRLARSGTEEWDVVVLCGGVLTLASVHRELDEHARATTKMAPIAEGEGA